MNENDKKRFWAKVDIPEDEDACWIWKGTRRSNYGIFGVTEGGKRKMLSAHRVSFFQYKGPTDLFVLHRCDNPPCVNPAHLFAGTHQDNMDDMYAKGRRQHKQPKIPQPRKTRKLSSQDIKEILEYLEKPYWGQVNWLAAKYGVDHSLISQIKAGYRPVSWLNNN
jgi:hypothetical protein